MWPWRRRLRAQGAAMPPQLRRREAGPEDRDLLVTAAAAADDDDDNDDAPDDADGFRREDVAALVPALTARNLRVEGIASLRVLPSQLEVLQVLDLRKLDMLERLPPDLNVQSLRIADCPLFCELPETLLLKGDLRLERLPAITTLPDAMEIEGVMLLDEMPALRTLPAYLRVQRDLFVLRCEALEILPDGVSVDGDIILENCPRVTSLPLSMIETRGTVRLRETGIDEEEAARLRGLAHPALRILVSFQELDAFESLAEAITFWWVFADDRPASTRSQVDRSDPAAVAEALTAVIEDVAARDALVSFLHKLRATKEFRIESLRVALAHRAREAVELILDDSLSRPQLLAQIASSVDTCGDMVVWALNQLMVWYHIAHARGDRAALRALGVRIMRLGIVHDHAQRAARRAAMASRSAEDVEVFLRFEIALREELDLPVSATEMLYPSLVNVQESDLREAREAALRVSEPDIEAWLARWDEWLRQDRLEASTTIDWEGLPESDEASAAPVLDLMGDPARYPVAFVEAPQIPCELQDLLRHWVATGRDFVNVSRSVDNFVNALRRVNAK